MTETSYIGASLASALHRQLDITANNIANANTAGYKGERAVFEALLQDNAPAGSDPAAFVADRGSYLDTRAGAVVQTGNPLDVALQGDGWLSYQTPDGQQAFGRDGNFMLDPQGNLVTLSGAAVLDAGGTPIALPPEGLGELTISADGTISGLGTGPLAQLGVFDLSDVQSYERIGNGMLVPPAGGGERPLPAPGTKVMQGALELSNVDAVTEMTRLIEVQRAYERTTTLMGNADSLRRDSLKRIGQAV